MVFSLWLLLVRKLKEDCLNTKEKFNLQLTVVIYGGEKYNLPGLSLTMLSTICFRERHKVLVMHLDGYEILQLLWEKEKAFLPGFCQQCFSRHEDYLLQTLSCVGQLQSPCSVRNWVC